MPEGPEIKILKDELSNLIKNSELNKILSYEAKTLGTSINNINQILPNYICDIKTKGKFIYWNLNKHNIGINLGLTGRFSTTKSNNIIAEFHFIKNTQPIILYYYDQRHFSKFRIMTDGEIGKHLNTLGVDIFDINTNNMDYLIKRTKKYQNKQIVQILMEQKIVSGIGNYLKAETLYHCKINPARLIKNLTDDEIKNIYITANALATLAYQNHGSIYYETLTSPGTFDFKVYKQKTDPNNNEVQTIELKDKRTTYWVPQIQI